jgi:hypothetical protein
MSGRDELARRPAFQHIAVERPGENSRTGSLERKSLSAEWHEVEPPFRMAVRHSSAGVRGCAKDRSWPVHGPTPNLRRRLSPTRLHSSVVDPHPPFERLRRMAEFGRNAAVHAVAPLSLTTACRHTACGTTDS